MRFTSVAPVLFAFFATAAFAVQDCELNGEHVNPANGNTTAGKTGMMKCRDRDSGQVVREQELRAGKFVGLVRYYQDGKPAREYTVNEKGNRDGLAREFYADGRVAREDTYRNGSTVGMSRTWHANGALKRIAVYGSDAGHAIAQAEFNDHGQLQDFFCADRPVMGKTFDDAALCGHGAREPVTHEVYSPQGKVAGRVAILNGKPVLSESFWDNGKPSRSESYSNSGGTSTWIERSFSRDGVKRREIQWTANGTTDERRRAKILEQEFHDNGGLVSERRWQDGALAQERTWYLNGQIKSDYRYVQRDGKTLCEATEYHDNGKPSRQGVFHMDYGYLDCPVGTVRGFDTEGRLRRDFEYDDKGHPTREREYDDKGTLIRDDAVFEDGSRKTFSAPAH